MNPRKPGRIFWVYSFVVGVFSPGTGKRRVNTLMQNLHKDNKALRRSNSELTSENEHLRTALYSVQGQNNMFLVQDEMNAALFHRTRRPDTENTMPLSTVN